MISNRNSLAFPPRATGGAAAPLVHSPRQLCARPVATDSSPLPHSLRLMAAWVLMFIPPPKGGQHSFT